MVHCADPDCRKDILHKIETTEERINSQYRDVRRSLFGETGTGGMLRCLTTKVPKRWFWIAVTSILLPCMLILLPIVASIGADMHNRIIDNCNRIDKLEQSYSINSKHQLELLREVLKKVERMDVYIYDRALENGHKYSVDEKEESNDR
jgi:hypothetical protein